MKFTFQPAGTNSNCAVYAHINSDETDLTGDLLWCLRIGAQLQIYEKNGSKLTHFNTTAVAGGVNEELEIRINGGVVTAYRDDVLLGTYYMGHTKGFGGIGLGINTGVVLTNIEYDRLNIVESSVSKTSDQLVGSLTATQWNNGEWTDGGNNINHPSKTGLAIFDSAIRAFLNRI